MYDDRGAWAALRDLTDRALAMADDVTVAIVANRKSTVGDEVGDRISEYLSDDEANQLLTGLAAAGFRTRYFDGERTFIEAVLEDASLGTATKRLLVYNIAQSGTDTGRKSLIPSFCALNGIATCNSGSYAVSLARNKLHVHSILTRFGLPTPRTWAFTSRVGWMAGERPAANVLLIAKACQESASIGLDESSIGRLTPGYETMLADRARHFRQPMVVQEFIEGREVEAPMVELDHSHAMLGPAAITIDGSDNLGSRFLSFERVFRDDYSFARARADQVPAVGLMATAAAGVCEVLGLSGFARVDFRTSRSGDVYVIDVSTSPHLVRHSSFAHVFLEAGWTHEEMMGAMVATNARRLGWL